jgi:hypothetical protein
MVLIRIFWPVKDTKEVLKKYLLKGRRIILITYSVV